MAFGFDPKAALARARDARPLPTPPIVPTVAPGKAETVGGIGTVGAPLAPENAVAPDPKTALACARDARPLPTPPTVPTVVLGKAETVGRIGGVGAPLAPENAVAHDLDAFVERAAIAQYDGGLSRAEAEALAAREQGFGSASELLAAAEGAR